jgi:prolyl-tRNA editing enzyme YbaK/EbsC (Cys-tRNA(Pro) deacylase)
MNDVDRAVREQLESLGVAYRIIDIDPDYADTAAFCERYGYSPEISVNCILVAAKTGAEQYAACLVLATSRLDVNRTVRRLMGVRKASFATAEQTVALTGMQIGGVTPFALPAGVPLYVDAPVMGIDEIIVGGGGRSTKVLVAPAALAKLPAMTVVDGLGIPI